MAVEITSPKFGHNTLIPAKYTCEGADVSPEIAWSGVPQNTKSLVLICDDPDAPMGTWVHWVAYDIPASRQGFLEAVKGERQLEDGTKQGLNDSGDIGYGGPCPPPGKPHRYYFKLYCLDTALNLEPGARKRDVELAMKGHVLEQTEIVGLYKR